MRVAEIHPILNNVLVEPIKAPAEKSGIFIPDAFRETSSKGKVIAAGPGKPERPMNIKPGDTVMFARLSGTPMFIEDKEYVFLTDDDIIARL